MELGMQSRSKTALQDSLLVTQTFAISGEALQNEYNGALDQHAREDPPRYVTPRCISRQN
jgi:hypothetical protein